MTESGPVVAAPELDSLPQPVARGAFLRRLRDHPNPVWMRELKQAARLQRTPIILAVVTGMMTLLICSVGGVASATAEPAKVGVGIFQTFFSLAYAVVTWVGPAVAANSIAGERSGRTWEALQLTTLRPRVIARGKFLAAFTYVSMYIVMLVPVGALPFLFGGVTATEVILAFVLLVIFAALSVAFGLAVSAKFASPAAAIIVTLLVALPASMLVYGAAGVGLSFVAHDQWRGVPAGPPVWLPTAYVRADFGFAYVTFLILVPAVLALIPAWLFCEVAVANMGTQSDDRSTRLRVWFLVSMPLLSATIALVLFARGNPDWAFVGCGLIWGFGCFGAFLFAGEPLGPSPRVLARWQRTQVGALRRGLGPGILRACGLLFLVTGLSLLGNAAVGLIDAKSGPNRDALLAFHGYALAFFGFLTGFVAWARARASGAGTPRLLLLVALFLAFVGPWIAMAIAGVITAQHDRAILMAAPSPTFAVTMAQALSSGAPDRALIAITGAGCAAAWALIGAGLFASAALRVKARVQAEQLMHASMRQAFEREDRARRASTSLTAD